MSIAELSDLPSDLQPLDPDYVANILSRPPFVKIDGVHNIRTLGPYPTTDGRLTRPDYLFRSAEVSGITDQGRTEMKNLGITHVFDLRSDTEMEKYKTPIPVIDGVNVIRTPVFRWEDYSPEMMAKRYQLYASGTADAFMELYTQILESGGPAFGTILRQIRDNKIEAGSCLFHCTAGKDRTGILAAIILKLVRVEDEAIAEDYALTRVGREPLRERIMSRLKKEPLFASNNSAALNMFASRRETMIAFLSMLQEKYGGVENYVKQYAGLSDEDIEAIRTNVLIPSNSLA